jgi:serine/threonine protein kinase
MDLQPDPALHRQEGPIDFGVGLFGDLRLPSWIRRYRVAPIRWRGKQVLGRGSYATVTLVEAGKDDKRTMAVKHSKSWNDRFAFVQEITHLLILRHPCVVKIYGWSLDPSNTFEIRMEYAENGDLENDLTRRRSGHRRPLNGTEKGRLICDIVLGMRYVHSRRIVHGDLKPENILLDGNGRALIADFGMSRPLSAQGLATREVGTQLYAAPEQLGDDPEYTEKVDVFAFGLILYEIIGQDAFAEHRFSTVPGLTIPDEFGFLMQDLIPRCWSLSPSDRPSFSEIFDGFATCGFAILPGVDANAIRKEVSEVLKGEGGGR